MQCYNKFIITKKWSMLGMLAQGKVDNYFY